jgi:uncharacterized surface protein with fasciclin (FAS1) repeats
MTSTTTTTTTTAPADLVGVAKQAGALTTLLTALRAARLIDTLKGPGPFTVFAPTDEAFQQLPAGTVTTLFGDLPMLRQLLLYHVVPGALTAGDVVQLKTATTATGQSVTFETATGVRVNDAKIVKTDIRAANGIIHVINRVLLPK